MPYLDKEKEKKAKHESYLRNKEKNVAKLKEKRRKFRQWVWDIKKGLKCSECGDTRTPVLEFHHTDPDLKEGMISEMARNPSEKQKQKILEEIEKCIVLCSNCHKIEHYRLKNLTEKDEGFLAYQFVPTCG